VIYALLENVAINGVLPLLTLNVFEPGDTSNLISMVSFTFTMRRHLIRPGNSAIYLYPFSEVCVPFADLREWRLATRQNV